MDLDRIVQQGSKELDSRTEKLLEFHAHDPKAVWRPGAQGVEIRNHSSSLV